MFKKLLLTSALLATFANAYAQQSQTVGMTGSIPPGACTVTLGANPIVPVGTLLQTSVRGYNLGSFAGAGNATYIYGNITTVSFAVNCTAATKIGLGFTDNNVGKNLLQGNPNDVLKFGFVDGATGASIGSFNTYLGSILLDATNTSPTGYFSSPTSTTPTWVTTNILGTTAGGNYIAPGNMNSFSKNAGATAPEAVSKITGNLVTSANFGKTVIDNMNTTLTFNGSSTLTLIYL